MEIIVKSLKGVNKLTGLDSLLSVDKLLQLIQQDRAAILEASGASECYLVHKDRVLKEGTLGSSGLVDGDTVVLLWHSNVQPPPELEDGPAPDAATIREAIKAEAQSRGLDVAMQEDEPPPRASRRTLGGLPRDLQDMDARLLQLISALGGHLHVMRDLPNDEGRSDEPASPPAEVVPPEPPAEALQQLLEMGFSEQVVRKALLLNRNQVQHALEWLLQHSEDPDAGEPVTQEQIRRIYGAPPRSRSVAATRRGGMRQRMIDQLVEMGFSAEDAGQAMDSFHTLDVALQWLLSRQTEMRGGSSQQGSAPPPTPSSEPSTPSAATAAASQQQQQAGMAPQEAQGFSDLADGSAAAAAAAATAQEVPEASEAAVDARQPGESGDIANGTTSPSAGPGVGEGNTDVHMQEGYHEGNEGDDGREDEDEDEDDAGEEEEDDDNGGEEDEEDDDEEEIGSEVFLPAFMASVSSSDMEQLMQGMSEMYGETPFLTGDMEGTEMLMRLGQADTAQLMTEMLQQATAEHQADDGIGSEEEEDEHASSAPAPM